MCYNEYVSFSTFIVGSICNILLYRIFQNRHSLALAIFWGWVLFMQLFEGIIWVSIKNNNKNLNSIGTYGAYIFNILQPIVLYASIMILTKQPKYVKILITIIIIFYSVYMLYEYITSISKKLKYTDNTDSCKHLNYTWWNNESGIVYVVCLLLMVILLVPHRIYKFQLCLMSLTLLVASSTQMRCSAASTWCLLATLSPILTIIYHMYVKFE